MARFEADLDTVIIDTVGSIVVVTDREGRIIRFNPAGTRILGYQPHEVLGRVLWELLSPAENRPQCQEHFEQLVSAGQGEFETVWLSRSGQRKTISLSCRSALDPSGRFEYTVGTGIDTTDRVAAATALHESELRFRTMFNDAAIGIALVDEKGRYLRVNRAFCALTGYDESELRNLDLFSITHPDDREANSRLAQRVFSGDLLSYVFEKRYITKSGEIIWVQVSASLASDSAGKTPTLIGLFENISDRRRAAEELRNAYAEVRALNETLEQRVERRTADLTTRTRELARSEQSSREQSRMLRTILDSIGDGIFVANGAGQLVWTNPAAERISGPLVGAAQSLEKRLSLPWFFRADGVTRYQPHELPLAQATRGDAVDDCEVLIRRPDRPELWVSATARPLRDESGIVSGGVVVLRDMTERKRHEAELEKANLSLRQSEHHFKELAESYFNLAREVEHRVRNNLAGLLGLITVMRHRAPDVRSFADAIESRISAMRHVHQLLAEGRWKAVGLRTLVTGALTTLGHTAPHQAATHIEGPETDISPQQMLPLTLVLVEWFTNSCKYGAHSAPGGQLRICWEVVEMDGSPSIRLSWIERGGPPIEQPVKSSLGTELVKGFMRRELRGKCELRYPPEGADHVLEFPLRAIQEDGREVK